MLGSSTDVCSSFFANLLKAQNNDVSSKSIDDSEKLLIDLDQSLSSCFNAVKEDNKLNDSNLSMIVSFKCVVYYIHM